MTLFKQLAILVSLVLVILSSVFIFNDFSRSARFLQGQLQTTAQDMSTTLGIAIGNSPGAVDEAMLEVLFNSVFDSGYYSDIRLVATDGSIIHHKNQQIELDNIPGWFLRMIQLEPAQGTTQVMQGWSQLGQLSLSLHPGYVYSSLYRAFQTTILWLGLFVGATILVLWLFIHFLLRPLRLVKTQADAIQNNQFVQQQTIPATHELKSVVLAMNRMVSKVKMMFDQQEQAIERYQHLLYHDKLSGLGNRRYLIDYLGQALAEDSEFHGCLGIIKLVDYDQLRERVDYEVTDQLVRDLADLLRQHHTGLIADKAARLNDDEFAFLVEADEETTKAFIVELYNDFRQLAGVETLKDQTSLVAGVGTIAAGQQVGDLLSRVDYCLTQAVSQGPYAVVTHVVQDFDLPQGKMHWRRWFEDVFANQRLRLVVQVALDRDRQAFQKEVFIRVLDAGNQLIPASFFMPMASRLGLGVEVDRMVFALVNQHAGEPSAAPLAVNLSAAFFELADGREDFEQMLISCAARGVRLCIEASHHVLFHNSDKFQQISHKTQELGHQFGVDNLDLGLPLQFLRSTRFDYVKINASNLGDIETEEVSSGFQALKTITDTLDIRIIVVGVDSQAQFDQLIGIGIEVMQGNLLGAPELF
jgi:EAL domain-containing protein (putative c-di-GMP-specific phosphodiesterase class I)/GGDEF domain-containing protein